MKKEKIDFKIDKKEICVYFDYVVYEIIKIFDKVWICDGYFEGFKKEKSKFKYNIFLKDFRSV